MRNKLTPAQDRVLEYFRQRIEENGQAPSLREAAGGLEVSHAAVAQALRGLEEAGRIRREGRYSRIVHLLNPAGEAAGSHRWREVPVIGRIQAGLPMYAQEEWDGTVVVDGELFGGPVLFALRVSGESMRDAGILPGDIAVCQPRQYAENGEIVAALVHGEEATVKRFYLHPDHVELRSANEAFEPQRYGFDEVLVQGKVVGLVRGPAGMEKA